MLDLLHDAHGRNVVAGLAKSLAVDPAQAETAARTIIDTLSDRIERATLSRSGLGDIVEMIGAPGRQTYLQPGTALTAPQVKADGIGILSQILGSRDASRAVAAKAASRSGLDAETVKEMLPSLAAVFMGSLAERTKATFGNILQIPGLDEIAKEARDDMGGGGPLAPPQYDSPLPRPGDPPYRPNPDWTGSAGNAGRPPAQQSPSPQPQSRPSGDVGHQEPLQIPGDDIPGMGRHEDNPYGDLADILRRGGFRIPGGFPFPGGGGSGPARAPGPAPRPSGGNDPGYSDTPGGGGVLDNIIRNILGSVLGYKSGGLLSWIIRFIVMKWGIGIVRSLLRRILGINI